VVADFIVPRGELIVIVHFARAWGYFFIFVDLDVGKKYLTRDYFLPK
jgi:hypothetical protein